MRSPFPGMDPYLEARWSDVHAKLVSYIGEAIQRDLPRDLRARSEERVLLETIDEESVQSYRSDIGGRGGAATAAAVATIEPVVVERYSDPVIDRFVQIIDVKNGNRVVTAIEILSPWNKATGRLNKDYLKKLDDYARGEVSVVEINLLRDPGRGRLQVIEGDIPVHRRGPYMVCVRKAWQVHKWLAYPITLREPLPRLPIPLRRKDAEIGLELQPLMERIYVASGHDDIDYSKPPDPRLPREDAAWAAELLKDWKRPE